MKTHHTPGPWHADDEGIVRHTGSGTAIKLASGYIENAFVGDDGTNETRANARLIAAAPDMLEALKGMDEAMCNGHETREARAKGRLALIACRAAIAKAAGEEVP